MPHDLPGESEEGSRERQEGRLDQIVRRLFRGLLELLEPPPLREAFLESHAKFVSRGLEAGAIAGALGGPAAYVALSGFQAVPVLGSLVAGVAVGALFGLALGSSIGAPWAASRAARAVENLLAPRDSAQAGAYAGGVAGSLSLSVLLFLANIVLTGWRQRLGIAGLIAALVFGLLSFLLGGTASRWAALLAHRAARPSRAAAAGAAVWVWPFLAALFLAI